MSDEAAAVPTGHVELRPEFERPCAPRRVTNVREDKILTSKFWRGSFDARRCLVPASSFCEPNSKVKPATWHWFALTCDEPRPAFAFPGIWRSYCGPVKKDGPNVQLEVFAFLTTTPILWCRGSTTSACP